MWKSYLLYHSLPTNNRVRSSFGYCWRVFSMVRILHSIQIFENTIHLCWHFLEFRPRSGLRQKRILKAAETNLKSSRRSLIDNFIPIWLLIVQKMTPSTIVPQLHSMKPSKSSLLGWFYLDYHKYVMQFTITTFLNYYFNKFIARFLLYVHYII